MDPIQYSVHKTDIASGDPLASDVVEGPWRAAEAITLSHAMGEPPVHRPVVTAKLLYDDSALYVAFRVEDRYVIATAERHQDSVCIDSCVEFFFTPGEDLDDGYFNVEANCGGTVLFNHQKSRGEEVRTVPVEMIERMGVRHSLPKRIVPEIEEPVTWTLRYRLSYDDLRSLSRFTTPAPGVSWRANLYKCADRCSHPHWLTWARVDLPAPDFHQKSFFGRLVFV